VREGLRQGLSPEEADGRAAEELCSSWIPRSKVVEAIRAGSPETARMDGAQAQAYSAELVRAAELRVEHAERERSERERGRDDGWER